MMWFTRMLSVAVGATPLQPDQVDGLDQLPAATVEQFAALAGVAMIVAAIDRPISTSASRTYRREMEKP